MILFSIYIIFLSFWVCILITNTNVKRYIKFIAILLLCHGYITIYSTFEDISGYPTYAELPQNSRVIWGNVVEPSQDYPGHIDIWIEYNPTEPETFLQHFSLATNGKISRIFRLNYNENNHKTMIKMLTKIKKGQHISLFSDQGSNLDLEEAQQKYEINYKTERLQK